MSAAEISCVQYFDGVATFEEISYRTGMKRRELDRVLQLYPDDVSGQCGSYLYIARHLSSPIIQHLSSMSPGEPVLKPTSNRLVIRLSRLYSEEAVPRHNQAVECHIH